MSQGHNAFAWDKRNRGLEFPREKAPELLSVLTNTLFGL